MTNLSTWDIMNDIVESIIADFDTSPNFESIRAWLEHSYSSFIADEATPFQRTYIKEQVEKRLADEKGLIF